MKSPSLARLWLAMVLIAGLGMHWAGAAEKIQFSTGNRDKDPKKNSLVIKQNKPTVQTLDFSRLGGRPSKAEEMAPMTLPPALRETDEDLPQEKEDKKKDEDWLTPVEKRERDEKELKHGKEQDQDKLRDKKRDDKNRPDDRQKNDPNRAKPETNDPFRQEEENQDPFNALNASGSSTNKILFGSNNPREDRSARGKQADGSSASRSMSRSSGVGGGLFDDQKQNRTSALERLGLEPRVAGSATGPGVTATPSANTGLFGTGTSQNSMNNGNNAQVSPLGQSMGARPDGFRTPGGRDSAFKSGLMNEMGSINLGQPTGQPKGYEPPKYERKPAVLPIPQRKF